LFIILFDYKKRGQSMQLESIKTILIVGAGVMGHGIAQAFAQAGYQVRLVDLDRNTLDRALARIKANLRTLEADGQITGEDANRTLKNIQFHTDLPAAAEKSDFVIEAVAEVPDVKKEIFSKLDALCPSDVILASNTSSLDLFSIVSVSNPSRVVAAHFFAPAQIIPLVEVCPGPETSPEVVALTARLMEKIGKEPVCLKKFVPSYIVNRIQNQISAAVFEMLINGYADAEDIDRAVKASLGIRLPVVGVVQSLDFTGLDVVHDIMKSRGITLPVIADRVARGELGAKTSKGFYDYQGRSEEEILAKRDTLYLKMLEHLKKIKAFEAV
jgi:3-hydroxyacyl-CoA dehydrogenase